tara:strand:- start:168 stop:629 length:462 start_codon:yes stop_codon:yes gene_type:complete
MPSIEYSGLKVSGGKAFAILTLLGALGSGAWAVFEFWKNYQDLTTKVLEYTAPDLSHYDEQIAVIKSELDMILDEINLVASVARDLKGDMKIDLRNASNDIRHITEIVNDIEDRQKADTREIFNELKLIEENLDLQINKALNNPLSNMSAKTK